MRSLMNKKGFENWDDLGMFILTGVILSLVIFFGLWTFYSVGADVRLEEAKSMSDKLAEGVLENGDLRSEILSQNYYAEELMKDSLINEEVIGSGGDFYFNISIYQGDILLKEFVSGRQIFSVECFLPGDSTPQCFSRELSVFDKLGGKYKIKILTGSNQLGGRL